MTTPAPLGLRERKRLDTWRTLRRIGLELMLERGFDEVSVDDVAAAASVSRTTFFNYFESKEALVFDVDPEDPEAWRSLFVARPADEPIWSSVQEIMIGYMAGKGVELATQKQLKARSARLAASFRDTSNQMTTELRGWVADRLSAPVDGLAVLLVMNSASSVMMTAYTVWDATSGIDEFLALARDGFARTQLQLPTD